VEDRERIKSALTDAESLCERLGFLGGRFGRDWFRQSGGVTIYCPFAHDEKTPSCSVTPAGGTLRVHCFGCKRSGDALDLIAAAHRLDVRTEFREVLNLAADYAGVARPDPLDRTPIVKPLAPRRAVPAATTPDDDLLDTVAHVLARRARVVDAPAAQAYLRARGLAESEASGWYCLPGDERARAGLRDALVAEIGPDLWRATGLASEDGGRWSGAWRGPRLVIPWRDPNGTVRTLQGRYLGDCPEGVAKYVFPRQRRPRWPFGCERLTDAGDEAPVVIVEGALDAVSLAEIARSTGDDVVPLAIPGTDGWRAEWLRLCRDRACVVALDADASGERRARDLALELCMVARRGPRGPVVRMVAPRDAKDWNEALTRRAA